MIIALFVVLGFFYGRDYFVLCKKYGTMKHSSIPIGVYILSFKWWNIKFNWYTRINKWYIDIAFVIPFARKKKEWTLTITSTGVKFCTVYIN